MLCHDNVSFCHQVLLIHIATNLFHELFLFPLLCQVLFWHHGSCKRLHSHHMAIHELKLFTVIHFLLFEVSFHPSLKFWPGQCLVGSLWSFWNSIHATGVQSFWSFCSISTLLLASVSWGATCGFVQRNSKALKLLNVVLRLVLYKSQAASCNFASLYPDGFFYFKLW